MNKRYWVDTHPTNSFYQFSERLLNVIYDFTLLQKRQCFSTPQLFCGPFRSTGRVRTSVTPSTMITGGSSWKRGDWRLATSSCRLSSKTVPIHVFGKRFRGLFAYCPRWAVFARVSSKAIATYIPPWIRVRQRKTNWKRKEAKGSPIKGGANKVPQHYIWVVERPFLKFIIFLSYCI